MSWSSRFFCARNPEGPGRLDVWNQFAVAVALVFVLEGLMPFLAPARWRDMVRQIAEVDDRTLRMLGLFSMLFGLGLLYLVN